MSSKGEKSKATGARESEGERGGKGEGLGGFEGGCKRKGNGGRQLRGVRGSEESGREGRRVSLSEGGRTIGPRIN